MTRFAIAPVLSALAAAFLSISAGTVHADEGAINWYTNVATARQAAASENRPIVMFVTAKWCGYCHKMEKTTLTDEGVAQKLQNDFVPLMIDADEHPALVKKLKIDGFPATLVFGPDGKFRERKLGYLTVAQASELLDEMSSAN